MKWRLVLYSMLLSASFRLAANNYVIINQVMYDTPLNEKVTTPPYSHGEFVELYNGSTSSVSLQGWCLSGDGSTERYYFPDISIPAKGYLAVAYRHANYPSFTLNELFPVPVNNPLFQIVYQNSVVLANGGETITLYNASSTIVDQMYYDGTSHLTKPDRLEAANMDSISGSRCVSLHRTWVEFDSSGCVVPGTSQYKTDYVTLASCQLAETDFGEHYLNGSQPLPTGANYIVSVTPIDPATRVSISSNGISVSNGVRTNTEIRYYDGLGRPQELIDVEKAPDRSDLVQLTHYSSLQRAAERWLPVAMHTEGQYADVSAVRSQAQSDYSDSRPYTETLYENSSLDRVIGHKRAGNLWACHPTANTYSINEGEENVRVYSVVRDSILKNVGEYYAAHTLYKTSSADEDGKSVITYTDKLGRTILVERDGNRTYYVYDDLGRLRYVLPHISTSQLTEGEYPPSNAVLRAAAYYYRYDNRGNVIYKSLPGCESQYMVYDQLNQLVLMQDGNSRLTNQWTMYAYDSIGRNLYTARIGLTQCHQYYIDFFADKWQVEHYGNNPANSAIPGIGYASTLLGKNNLRLLTVNYYDDYDYLNKLTTAVRKNLQFKPESGYGLQHDNALGLLTGTRVYNLSDDTYTATAYYYDTYGRVVQLRSTRNAGDMKIISSEYLFDGSLAQQLSVHVKDSDEVREHYRYTYDHAGRPLQTCYKLNNEAEIILSSFSYDNTGRLVRNLLHDQRDTIRYSYDMRNLLTTIHGKHFCERLYYADSLPQHAAACYNGNIAATRLTLADSAYTFAYTYDALNRLRRSAQVCGGQDMTSEQFEYDDRGNILTLQRYDDSRAIDNLEFIYQENGNLLLSVQDAGEDADLYETVEYHDTHEAATSDEDMCYDANGNLIADADRGISVIRYNILNLPDTIQFINGNQIVNMYDAAGHKCRSVVYTNLATAVTPCYDIVHYSLGMDSVEYRITEYMDNIENYYTPRDSTRRIFNATGYYSSSDSAFHYNLTDHLGNICAVVNASADSVVQRTMYYASGVPMSQSVGREVQPYLYNGKEFIEAHGLDEYDYGFRNYYATIGRFSSIDPLAETTQWQSPYTYAGNNQINNIDWMGLMKKNRGLHYTEIGNDGRVILHIDNDDYSVVLNGEKIGTELDDEEYIEGQRAYFRHKELGVTMIYNYYGGQYVRRSTPLDERVAIWLRAQNVDEIENNVLEYSRPFVQDAALLIPILSHYNAILMFTEGKNIYGNNTDNIDKGFAIVSLLSSGVNKLVPLESLTRISRSSDFGAFVYSLLKDYEILPQEDPYGNID